MSDTQTMSPVPSPDQHLPTGAQPGALKVHEQTQEAAKHLPKIAASAYVMNYVVQVLTQLELANNYQVAQYSDIQNMYNAQVESNAYKMGHDASYLAQTLPEPTATEVKTETGWNKYLGSSEYINVTKHNQTAQENQSALQSQSQVLSTSAGLYGSQSGSITSVVGQLLQEVSSFISATTSVVAKIFNT